MERTNEEKIQAAIDDGHFGVPFAFNKKFTGPLPASKRFCTSTFCLLVVISWSITWIVVGSIAISRGTLHQNVGPYNSDNKQCGVDSGFENDKYLMYFDFTQCEKKDGDLTCYTPTVCLESCPSTLFIAENYSLNDYTRAICKPNITLNSQDDLAVHINNGECARWYFPTKSISRRCVILDIAAIEKEINNTVGGDINWKEWEDIKYGSLIAQVMTQSKSVRETSFDAIGKKWHYLIIGLLLAMVFCIVYLLIILRYPWIFVWFSIAAVISLLAWCAYDFWTDYQAVKISSEKFDFAEGIDSVSSLKSTNMAFFIISIIALVILLLIFLFLRNRISMAVALIAESSRVVASMKSTLLFPICLWFIQVALIVWAVTVWMNLAYAIDPVFQTTGYDGNCNCTDEKFNNNGTPCEPEGFSAICGNCVACVFKHFEERSYVTRFYNTNIFAFFSFSCIICGFCDTVLAGTFATWYWTFNKSEVPFFALGQSIQRTLRYNLGTVAYGAVAIALSHLFRIIFETIDKFLKKCNEGCRKHALCCMCCCFCCYFNILDFITSDLYIMCAIHGNGFSYSIVASRCLILRNSLRVSALNKVTDFLFFLGKISVTAAMVVWSLHIFRNKIDVESDDEIPQYTYYLLPVMIVGIGTYFIASMFFSVYAMAVDTLFLCFCEDLERNDGSLGRPYYMPKNLMTILSKRRKKDEDRLNIIYM